MNNCCFASSLLLHLNKNSDYAAWRNSSAETEAE